MKSMFIKFINLDATIYIYIYKKIVWCPHNFFVQKRFEMQKVKKVEDNEIRKQLKENNYPINLINKFYRKRNNTNIQQWNHSDPENPPKFIGAPYIRGASERIARVLRPHGKTLAQKPTNTLKSILSKTKDKMKIEERNDVVYKIPCKDCNLCYIGETSKQVIYRVEEHKKNVNQKYMSSLIYYYYYY